MDKFKQWLNYLYFNGYILDPSTNDYSALYKFWQSIGSPEKEVPSASVFTFDKTGLDSDTFTDWHIAKYGSRPPRGEYKTKRGIARFLL